MANPVQKQIEGIEHTGSMSPSTTGRFDGVDSQKIEAEELAINNGNPPKVKTDPREIFDRKDKSYDYEDEKLPSSVP